MPELTGSSQAISLGHGYALRSPGIRGTAELLLPRNTADRSRSRAPVDGTPALDAALAATNVTEVRIIELHLLPRSPADATRALRGVDGQETLELQVPDLGPETGQVVLSCDETGVMRWHLPVDELLRVQSPTTRGAGGLKRFRIPAAQPRLATPSDAATRSLLGVIGRKLVKILIYPITDPMIGTISEFFAERWEEKYRPYGLRSFTPEERRIPNAGTLIPADWDRLCAGRALLFIHGTFSTAHAAFTQIPDSTFATLYERYGGRVFAFNHFTLSHDPRRNVEWLLSHLPQARSLEVDIICHSRGGLVARTLAERPSVFGLDASNISVRRIVFVAVPNHGTALAHADHMVKMVDRLTTSLNLFPSGPVSETLEALITVVKVIGHGVLKGLDGLTTMQPDGDFLNTLNQGGQASEAYHAVAGDYEPTDEGLRALLTGATNAVVDLVFEKVPNDIVVPEPGVFGANGSTIFPIPDTRVLKVPSNAGVIHTTMFDYPPVSGKLTEWLA
jgi:pimeloyl-ACP methyl ester carboxylesterase